MINNSPSHIWLLQDGEQLPIDSETRQMRTGRLAQLLSRDEFQVTWWSSRFHHNLKIHRDYPTPVVEIGSSLKINLLDGPGYKNNISWARIRHHQHIASEFLRIAPSLTRPSLILASYPSPELCYAASQYASKNNVPFIIDIRDPWPDIFAGYFPSYLKGILLPILSYYRSKLRAILKETDGILAVSDAMLNWGLKYANREKRIADRVFYIGYDAKPVQKKITVPIQFSEEDPLRCLFVSTCGRSYDGETLIKAARILQQKGERRIRFIVTGEGEQRQKWLELAGGLEMITFTGWISHTELESHMAAGHVGLILMQGGLSSFWLGNKFAEYLSSNLALINNMPGEAADLVKSHTMGINIPAKDPQALADALSALVSSPDRVRLSMENANKIFLSKFESTNIYAEYVDYLKSYIHDESRSIQPLTVNLR